MVAKKQQCAKAHGQRFSKDVLNETQTVEGDDVQVTALGGRINVELLNKVRGRYKLAELVSKIPKGYRAQEVDWGSPIGKEV